jgi:hypothetical protein
MQQNGDGRPADQFRPYTQSAICLDQNASARCAHEHPLPHRQRRQHVIVQMRRRRHHAPGVARWTYGPASTGESNHEVVPARRATGPGKTTTEDSTFEIAAKRLLDIGRRCRRVRLGREGQPSLEVGLDGALPQRVFGTAALIAPGARRRRFDCGRQGTTRVCG